MFKDKTVVLAVTGGIAAYKSAILVRELKSLGADVFVIMTEEATEFVTPLTFETLSKNQVAVGTFDRANNWNVEHVALADTAELLIVAPATANIISKTACAIADDLVSTTTMTMLSSIPILMVPAMNTRMWENPILQGHVQTLKQEGVHFIGPDEGELADDKPGIGRMTEISGIIEAAKKLLSP